MKKEFNIDNSKFVYTKNELAYQDVIDEMQTASKIVIVTYNISRNHQYLLNCLKKTSNECEIVIVSNMPQRWESYRDEEQRKNAQKQIRLYLNRLKPEEIGARVGVFFDFHNHGKIIMTDKVVYIGSANYSESSSDNAEFGIISRDTNFISFLLEKLIPDITEKAEPYYEYDFFPLLLESKMAVSAFYKLINEFHDQAYRLHDDIDGKWYIYNSYEDVYSQETFRDIIRLLRSMHAISTDIYNALTTITKDDEDVTSNAADISDNIWSIARDIENLLTSSELWALTSYDINESANSMLQNEYASEAYEEKLEHYVKKALEKATGEFFDIAESAEETIKSIFKNLKEFKNEYIKIHSLLRNYNLRSINPKIDNT